MTSIDVQELMVTLKNNGGVEFDKDSVMNMYNGEVTNVEENPPAPGHAKAVLICRKNSHPFQERTLTLDQPVKIGRSVARARPSGTNGIFDCKVLSRNHALIWYDNEKFFIHDTKSSNGTFVNNQRLSKGAEDIAPREIFSGDVVQFGVDVLENQRKGNEDSDDSVDSVHIGIEARQCGTCLVRSCAPLEHPHPLTSFSLGLTFFVMY